MLVVVLVELIVVLQLLRHVLDPFPFFILLFFSMFLPSTSSVVASQETLLLRDTGLFGTSETPIPTDTIWQLTVEHPGIRIVTSEGVYTLAVPEASNTQIDQLRVAILHFIAPGK